MLFKLPPRTGIQGLLLLEKTQVLEILEILPESMQTDMPKYASL
jgi:hypothetical protein